MTKRIEKLWIWVRPTATSTNTLIWPLGTSPNDVTKATDNTGVSREVEEDVEDDVSIIS